MSTFGGQFRTWRFVCVAVMAAAAGLVAQPAKAADPPLALCNLSSYAVRAAIAVEGGNLSESRGWFELLPGACAEVWDKTPRRSGLFVFAESLPAYAGGRRVWSGLRRFCVAEDEAEFRIAEAGSCKDGMNPLRSFARAEAERGPGGPQTISLRDNNRFDMERARIAGGQRLLIELGFLEPPADGYVGPQTRTAISDFLEDRAQSWDGEFSATLMNALLDAAKAQIAETGLRACNDAEDTIWLAYGVKGEGETQGQARGWWPVESGACKRLLADLPDADTAGFLYAETRDGKNRRLILKSEGPLFCLDIIPFDVEAGDCLMRGLRSARFEPVKTEGKVLEVRFGPEDFRLADDEVEG
jgi:uncharacterized membrane protein